MAILNKEYLRDYSRLLEEIECEEERLKAHLSRVASTSTGTGGGAPRNGSGDPDKMATQVCIITDLRNRLEELHQTERDKRQYIETALSEAIDLPQERRVIRLKYIDRMEWTDIRANIYGHRRDYNESRDKYDRLAFRLHGNALSKLSKWSEKNSEVIVSNCQ